MFVSLTAFIGWLLLPQVIGVVVFGLALHIFRRWTSDEFPARFVAVLLVPVSAISSYPLFAPIAEEGARRCGAWGAFILFSLAPVVVVQIIAAIFLQATIAMIRDANA